MSSGGHIRQRSPGSWELRWRANGKVVTRTVRGTKAEAKAALRAAMGAVDRGEHVNPSKITVTEHVQVRIDHWHATGRIGARCVEIYEALLVRITAGPGSIALQKLTTLDIERWHGRLFEQKLSIRTVRAAHALLARALADGVRHHLVARNVARDQGSPAREPSPAVTAPNADQVAALLAKLNGDLWRVPVITAIYTGLRRGEQLALRWSDVDLKGAKLTVARALDETRTNGIAIKFPKTAAGRRTISLPAVVVEALREHRRQQLERCLLLGLGRPSDDALVFSGIDGQPMPPRAFSQRWGRKADKLGMPELTWHALRHAHASMLIAAGVPITTVAARLGHADPVVTLRVYAHLFDKDDTAAAAAIDRALGR
jgi:integrase